MSTETKFLYWDAAAEAAHALAKAIEYAAQSGTAQFDELEPATAAHIPDETEDVYGFLCEQYDETDEPWVEKRMVVAVFEFLEDKAAHGWEELHHDGGGPWFRPWEEAVGSAALRQLEEALEFVSQYAARELAWEMISSLPAIQELRTALANFMAAFVDLSEAAYQFTGRTLTVFADGTWQLKQDESEGGAA